MIEFAPARVKRMIDVLRELADEQAALHDRIEDLTAAAVKSAPWKGGDIFTPLGQRPMIVTNVSIYLPRFGGPKWKIHGVLMDHNGNPTGKQWTAFAKIEGV